MSRVQNPLTVQQPLEQIEAILDVGRIFRGEEIALAPHLDNFDVFKFFRQPSKASDPGYFLLVLYVDRFMTQEVDITFGEKNTLELKAKHGRRLDRKNIMHERTLQYKWRLPEGVTCLNLQARWTADNFLIINSTKFHAQVKNVKPEHLHLIPQRCPTVFRSFIDLSVMNEMVEDIRDKAQHALQFMRMKIGHSDTWDSEETAQASDDVPSQPEDVAGPSKA